jgi:hypothetical protein
MLFRPQPLASQKTRVVYKLLSVIAGLLFAWELFGPERACGTLIGLIIGRFPHLKGDFEPVGGLLVHAAATEKAEAQAAGR